MNDSFIYLLRYKTKYSKSSSCHNLDLVTNYSITKQNIEIVLVAYYLKYKLLDVTKCKLYGKAISIKEHYKNIINNL